MTSTTSTSVGQVLGYARVSTGHQSLDAQTDALTAAGVDPARVYSDELTGTSTKEQRAGLAAVLDYARSGDTIVVVGIGRLGRNAAEVMLTIGDLGQREIVLRSLREGIDTSNATGRMVAGVLASLAELELELGRERRTASRAARKARGLDIGRPRKLTPDQIRQAEALRASGEPTDFRLDDSERLFLTRHTDHDVAYCAAELTNAILGTVMAFPDARARNDWLRRCSQIGTADGVPSPIAETIRRLAPTATVINDFYWQLHDGHCQTEFPSTALATTLSAIGQF